MTSSKNVIAVWTAFCAIGPVADNDPNLEDPRHAIPKCLAEANGDYLDQAVDHLCSTCSIFKGRQRSLAATVNARRIGSRKEERRRQLVVARAAIAGTETAYIFLFIYLFILSSHLQPMDLIITILPVVTKDLPISPRFTPYIFFIAMQVQHSYNSSTNGRILLTHVPTLSVTKERTQVLLW